jgi:iron complex outermembrane receptor protein
LAIYSLCTFGAIGFSVPAYPEDDFFDLSIMELVEVVVSVQKRDVLLQNAPASVLVIDSESIDRFHINQTLEVINHVPGFTINADNLTEPNLFMRGVGTDIESAASNSAIGFFMDDIYLSRSMAYAMDIFDIQRIEILRGPQGTLYGKNVVGGVVNFVSNKPTVENTAIVQASAGSYNTLEMNGVASGQVSDSMLGRIAFASRSHDGYAKNTYTGNDMDDLSSSGFRAQLSSNPLDELDVMVTVDKHRRSNAGKWIDMKIPSENNLPFKNSDPRKGPNNIDGKENTDIAGLALHVFWAGEDWALT